MANISITKEVYLMANIFIDIDEVNELHPQIIFDELQNVFEELYHDFKKIHKKNILL
jgi:hypothetical protein